jgi:hypothetical protein
MTRARVHGLFTDRYSSRFNEKLKLSLDDLAAGRLQGRFRVNEDHLNGLVKRW